MNPRILAGSISAVKSPAEAHLSFERDHGRAERNIKP